MRVLAAVPLLLLAALPASAQNAASRATTEDGRKVLLYPLARLKEIAVTNARDAAPDVKVTFEEPRRVNEVDVVAMQMEGTIQGIPFTYYGYYFSGPQGSVQLLTYTGSNLFAEYKPEFEDLCVALLFKGDPDALRRITSEDMGRAGFLPKVQFTKEHPWRDGAEWNKSFTFPVPGGWPSGIYSASLTSLSPSFTEPLITFAVKPAPGTHSDVAVLANVNTWLAYNRWGGKGKYQGKTPVSFMRPKPSTSLIADNPEDIMPRREDLPSPIVHRSDPQHLTRGEL